ncbi:MAG: DUF4832 domain-containing protein [Thermoguttaceae bacterium]|nr:DUF4832 domain-containing protein [Thermoguttaceae bacterium]
MNVFGCLGVLGVLVAVPVAESGAEATATNAVGDLMTVRFSETDNLFANPGKGWMTFQRMPGREPRLPCSVAYFRLDWQELEPTPGEYRFEAIDEAIRAWEPRGVRVALRVMTANAHTRGYYCSPKWLFDAGCNSYEYTRGGEDTMEGGKRITRIEPDYSDPLFLEKHAALLAAIGKRYDGHPRIEFLDIGSYGIWGEWHTPNGKPWEVRRQIIDMYLENFRTTPLVSMSDDAQALVYALAHGTGFRRDGVGSPWHEENWIGSEKYKGVPGMAEQWKRAPVVFEWFGPYDFLQRRGWSFDRAVEFILANHATYINDNIGPVPEADWPKVERLARLSGYRFVLRELKHPAAVARGGTLDMTMRWSNVGVGKLYRPYPLVLYLLNKDGTPVHTQEQPGIDATQWLRGDHEARGRLDVPANVPPGEYLLAIALVDPATRRPAIRLAIDVPETDRIHRLSRVRVE